MPAYYMGGMIKSTQIQPCTASWSQSWASTIRPQHRSGYRCSVQKKTTTKISHPLGWCPLPCSQRSAWGCFQESAPSHRCGPPRWPLSLFSGWRETATGVRETHTAKCSCHQRRKAKAEYQTWDCLTLNKKRCVAHVRSQMGWIGWQPLERRSWCSVRRGWNALLGWWILILNILLAKDSKLH